MSEFIKTCSLDKNEAHVWLVDTEMHFTRFNDYLGLLSTEEKQRAKSYIFEKHSNLFVIRRAILRIILSYYLNIVPKNLVIKTDPRGKPYLDYSPPNIFFNLSHSNSLIYYAISSLPCIGIDIEYIQEKHPEEELAKLVLHNEEYKIYKHLTCFQKKELFYRFWCQKEALLKGIGIGLAYPPSNIHINFSDPKTPKLISFELEECKNWSFSLLDTPLHYVGYIALQGHLNSIKKQIFINGDYA